MKFLNFTIRGASARQPSSAAPPCGESEDFQEQSALQEEGNGNCTNFDLQGRWQIQKTEIAKILFTWLNLRGVGETH